MKHSITTGAGVIDADYRGQVKILLFNLGDKDFAVNEGDRIAQLVIERVRRAKSSLDRKALTRVQLDRHS